MVIVCTELTPNMFSVLCSLQHLKHHMYLEFMQHEILYNFLICFDTKTNFIDRVVCGDFFVTKISLANKKILLQLQLLHE